jgi:gluconate 2-dehydrogenase gamma chain
MATEDSRLDRRQFLQRTLLAAGTAAAGGAGLAAAEPGAGPGEAPAAALNPGNLTYLSFGPDEAALVEALVNVMCPADHLTPNGVDCGLAFFIDRQLAGAFGKGDRLYRKGPWRRARPELGYQLPLTPEEFFKAGLAAADAACLREHRARFAALSPLDADRFLQGVSEGRIADPRVPMAEWFNDLVLPLFNAACFADPIYGGNQGMAFWKMIGYPGLPAVHGLNVVKYRGKPFPGGRAPQSIADFS